MKKAFHVFCLLLIFLSFQAKAGGIAGLFVEPMLTYEDGKTTTHYPAPFSDSTGTMTGPGLGARLGIHFLSAFLIGVDGRYSMPQYKDSTGYDEKSVSSNWGPVVGVQMPIMGLRLWAGSITDGELNPDDNGNFDIKYQKARGSRIGAGFRIAAVSLNAEYQTIKYEEAILERSGPFAPGTSFTDMDLENKSWLFSVSFPLEL